MPEIQAVVSAVTGTVVTLKVADRCPAATVTLRGTAAWDGRELVSITTIPAGGAGPESVTVPLTLAPPTTVDGLSVSEDVAGSVTVNVAVLGAPPLYEAEMTADVPAGTAVVEMAKLADN